MCNKHLQELCLGGLCSDVVISLHMDRLIVWITINVALVQASLGHASSCITSVI